MPEDFRDFKPDNSRIVLIEAGKRLLPAFHESLSERAKNDLEEMGVEVCLEEMVTGIDEGGVTISRQRIESKIVLWGAGVAGTPVGEWLSAEVDRQNRVLVDEFCRLPGRENVYIIGDVAAFTDASGSALPGVATVAVQQGAFVGQRLRTGESERFEYRDPGSMATVGRSKAVVQRGNLRLTGVIAWLAWLFVHLVKLVGSRNRLMIMIQWIYSYFSFQRGARVILPGSGSNPVEPRRES